MQFGHITLPALHTKAGTSSPDTGGVRQHGQRPWRNRNPPADARLLARPRYAASRRDAEVVLHAEHGSRSDSEARADREKIHAIVVPPVGDEPLQQSAEDWTNDLTAHAATLDFELFGITAFNPVWSFEDNELKWKWIIMLGVAHDYDQIKTAPGITSGAEVIRQYGRASKASKDVATWIHERGWEADHYDGPGAGPLLMIPHAIQAGFGELGNTVLLSTGSMDLLFGLRQW